MKSFLISIFILISCFVFSQNVSLYHQFNGRYDFTFIGNTMNPMENSYQSTPDILTTSSATLSLLNTDVIESAYLYWAGSGTGDFNVSLNSSPIVAERTFAFSRNSGGELYDYFSAFANITSFVQTTGNGVYTLSDLDVSTFLNQHFQIKTNFSGWAIVIIYKNNSLPLNQINIYDGLQDIPIGQITEPAVALSIYLDNLNVIDNNDAKIGFLAWEGDDYLDNNETLRINGVLMSNPPLNPATNAFNGTDTFTNSAALYNMDLDVYSIQNNIAIGDTSAVIKLTSGQDFVMINTVVTKLNSQLPDATIENKTITQLCDSRKLVLNYQVKNLNATNTLNSATPIAFYANNQLIGQAITLTQIPIDGVENGTITLTIPTSIPDDFILKLMVDDSGNGTGIVTELIENNNNYLIPVLLWVAPQYNKLNNIIICKTASFTSNFNFANYNDLVKIKSTDQVFFYENESDANLESNPIQNTSNYEILSLPKTIFVKIKNQYCSSLTTFSLNTKKCIPTIFNFISNNSTQNSNFYIEGLRDVFINFKLEIYNRWGRLLWIGTNNSPDWTGESDFGNIVSGTKAADGTYFYILYLNDPDYTEPLKGFLYFVNQ